MSDDSGSPPVDVRLEALMGAVEDVREEMHSGLSEVRQLVDQSREAVFRVESMLSTSDPGASLRVVERVENVRAIAERTRRRQSLLIGVVVAQALMLAVAVVFLVMMRADVQREVTAATVTDLGDNRDDTLSATAEPRLEEPENSSIDASKRRRLGRRHR